MFDIFSEKVTDFVFAVVESRPVIGRFIGSLLVAMTVTGFVAGIQALVHNLFPSVKLALTRLVFAVSLLASFVFWGAIQEWGVPASARWRYAPHIAATDFWLDHATPGRVQVGPCLADHSRCFYLVFRGEDQSRGSGTFGITGSWGDAFISDGRSTVFSFGLPWRKNCQNVVKFGRPTPIGDSPVELPAIPAVAIQVVVLESERTRTWIGVRVYEDTVDPAEDDSFSPQGAWCPDP